MRLRERQVCGAEYLDCVTLLLQRARQASPTRGLWEAADFQWWWRRDQHDDPGRQFFWFDDGYPAAAVILTSWGDRFSCDLLSADHDLSGVLGLLWPVALGAIGALGDVPVEVAVRDDDAATIDAVVTSGFSPTSEASVATWMPAADRPPVSTIPAGFRLAARSDCARWPHHLAPRNGDQVADRLAECSLYRHDLDLAVYAPDGQVAGYGLFWADPVTGVGLVEPMRTNDRYQGMGLGRHVLTAGLNLLAARGCRRFKVSHVSGYDPSRRLYLGAGFCPESTSRIYRAR
jgi:predicted N-acetyltransferase YhbS